MDLQNYLRVNINPHAPSRSDDPQSADQISFLMAANRAWRQIDRELQKLLPAYLHPYFQTACIREGRLIVMADNPSAASRLKMLLPPQLPAVQNLVEGVQIIEVRVKPQNHAAEKQKNLNLPAKAVESLRQAAEGVQHHPKLAAALEKLATKHGKA